jgi:ABC-type multidrug transport system ATPase subunit
MNPSHAITVSELSKQFGTTQALRKVSFDVGPAELFGLIGPDGAGKTTLLRILVSLLKPDTGHATVLGWNTRTHYRQIRKHAGYMAGRFSLYPDLTVAENLRFYATIFNTTIAQNYHLIADIYQQLEPFSHRKAAQLSGGMKQKLALCCALIHQPKVLFLDEPTTGVDPVSRNEFWTMLTRLKSFGITIMVSTPYMDEAARCDTIALMQHGKMYEVNSPQHIIRAFSKPLWAVQADNIPLLIKTLRSAPWHHAVFPFGETVHLSTAYDVPQQTIAKFLQQHLMVGSLQKITPGIEDCFMDFALTDH